MKRVYFVVAFILIVMGTTNLQAQRLQYVAGTTVYISSQHQARIFFSIDDRLKFGHLRYKPFSFTFLEDAAHQGKYFPSLNPVFGALYGITSPFSKKFGQVLLLPQILGNFYFKFPISGKNYNLLLGQTTDYFFVRSKPELVSETTLGVHANIGGVVIGLDAYYPAIHSALKQRKLSFGVVLAYDFY